MNTILIKSKSRSDIDAFMYLAKKLGLIVKILSVEEQEDAAFLSLINKTDRNKKVSEKLVMQKLKK